MRRTLMPLANLREVRHVASIWQGKRLRLTGKESFLILAPHCDDETLGAGLLMCEAAKLGCRIKVCIVTNGDGFTYAAGRRYKRLRLKPERHIEFAQLRQKESLRALARLGVQRHQVVFLGYPDRGLQALWYDYWTPEKCYRSPYTKADYSPYVNSFTRHAAYCGYSVVDDIQQLIEQVNPTHIIVPHPRDTHADHTATFCFAIHALEELRTRGLFQKVQVLCYLIHRGPWPQPRGLNPRLQMVVPPSFSPLGEQWMAYFADGVAINAKQRSILEYHSQLSILGRFLLSFIRRNELFSLYEPMFASCICPGVLLDGSAHEWPNNEGYVLESARNTITRNMEKGADIRVMAASADAEHMYIRLETSGRLNDEVAYYLRITSCQQERWTLQLRLIAPDRVLARTSRRWYKTTSIVCRSSGQLFEVAIPRHLLGNAEKVFLFAETRLRRIRVDKTSWQLIVLPPAGTPGYLPVYAVASKRDIPTVAAVFSKVFTAEINRVLEKQPPTKLLMQVFELLYDAEAQALIVAKIDGRVVGYIYAPVSLHNLWRTALLRGHIMSWLKHWLRGQYHFSRSALRIILLDKFYFVRSSLARENRVEQRVLSIGVLPEYRNRGIATGLVKQALNRFEQLGVERVRLEVRPENVAAYRLYERLGFVTRNTIRDTRGEWLVMVKEFNSARSLPTDPHARI